MSSRAVTLLFLVVHDVFGGDVAERPLEENNNMPKYVKR